MTVRTESLQPEDMGQWKMKIVDQYEENFNFTFRIQAEGKMAENNNPIKFRSFSTITHFRQ